MEILPISLPVKKGEFDLFDSIILSNFKFRENDILIVSSKYVSISEGSVMNLDKVKVGRKAKSLASEYHMSAKLAELTLREADYIYKGIPGFLLAVKNGVLAPNAGIDKSNVPQGFVVLYPSEPFKSAENLRRRFLGEWIETAAVQRSLKL